MPSDAEKIQLAQNLISQLGLRWTDLAAPHTAPILSDYLPQVIAAANPTQRAKYGTYWNRAERLYGETPLDDIRVSDLLALQQEAINSARRRSNSRHGRHAGEGCLRAMRFLYRLAIADGLISSTANPAAAIPLPRRLPNPRRALTSRELAAIYDVVYSSGNDIALDSLLLRLHLETACRRGGALALTLQRPRRHLVLGAATGEGRNAADTAHQSDPVRGPAHPRRPPRRYETIRRTAALLEPHTADEPTLRPPLDPRTGSAALGRHTRRINTLAAPHHTHLGRTQLQLRHRPRLRRPHRHQERLHPHLHQRHATRSRHRTINTDGRTTPALAFVVISAERLSDRSVIQPNHTLRGYSLQQRLGPDRELVKHVDR